MKLFLPKFIFLILLIATFSARAEFNPGCERLLGSTVFLPHSDYSEKEMIQAMQQNLPELYLSYADKAKKEMAAGNMDFSFLIMRPTLQHMAKDLQRRHELAGNIETQEQISKVLVGIKSLLQDNVPYRKMVEFMFRQYLPLLDDLFLKRHPKYKDRNYHRGHAEHLLEDFINRAPDILLYFTFEPVTEKFFIHSRTAPLYLVGLNLGGLDDGTDLPFADGFQMKPSEFSWHDMGHIDFMFMRDQEYIISSNKPLERIFMEWEATKKRYMVFLDQFKGDKDLYDAMTLLMFEVVHERGYQYSLTVLKKEIETQKWLEVIRRKIANSYYDPLPFINQNAFPRLEQARQLILGHTMNLRLDAQLKWFHTLQADRVTSRFIYNAPLQYGIGQLKRIEITGASNEDIKLFLSNASAGGIQSTDISHMILAQEHVGKVNPFGEDDQPSELRFKIQHALTLVKRGEYRSIDIDGHGRVHLAKNNGELVSIETVDIDSAVKPTPIENLAFFKIAQALGVEERKALLHYTIESPQKVMAGTGEIFVIPGQRPGNDRTYVRVREAFGTHRELGVFNIQDLRIDTLNLIEN